jgi:hypothetical protein
MMKPVIVPASTGLKNVLVSCFGLNEASGSVAYDLHGSYDGANSNISLQQTTVANLQYSYGFNGSNSYVTLPYGILPNISTSDFSVSLWFYTADTYTLQYLFDGAHRQTSGVSVYDGFAIRIYQDQMSLFFGNNSTSGLSVSNCGAITQSAWNHVLFTKSGTTVNLYVNGALTHTDNYTFHAAVSTGTLYTLGALRRLANPTGLFFLNGKMDQVATWNRELTGIGGEVTTLYSNGNGNPYTSWT